MFGTCCAILFLSLHFGVYISKEVWVQLVGIFCKRSSVRVNLDPFQKLNRTTFISLFLLKWQRKIPVQTIASVIFLMVLYYDSTHTIPQNDKRTHKRWSREEKKPKTCRKLNMSYRKSFTGQSLKRYIQSMSNLNKSNRTAHFIANNFSVTICCECRVHITFSPLKSSNLN